MSLKIEFITTAREDLFSVFSFLARAVDAPLLQDAANPVSIAVRGSRECGKKIVSDAMREELLGSTSLCSFRGTKEYDEYWMGAVKGQEVEVNFINLAWNRDYHSAGVNMACRSGQAEEAFRQERRAGGLAILQNLGENHRANIEIWLEKRGANPVYGRKPRADKSSLSPVFNALPISGYWNRYIEIEIHDPRLLESSVFRKACDQLTEAAAAVQRILEDPGQHSQLNAGFYARHLQSAKMGL